MQLFYYNKSRDAFYTIDLSWRSDGGALIALPAQITIGTLICVTPVPPDCDCSTKSPPLFSPNDATVISSHIPIALPVDCFPLRLIASHSLPISIVITPLPLLLFSSFQSHPSHPSSRWSNDHWFLHPIEIERLSMSPLCVPSDCDPSIHISIVDLPVRSDGPTLIAFPYPIVIETM